MSALLLKNTNGVFRIFAGWVDYAKRKTEHAEHSKRIYRGHQMVAYVEKTSEAIAAYAKRFENFNLTGEKLKPLTIWSDGNGGQYTIAEYLKIRADRKAAKLAKKAKKLDAEQVEQKTAAIVSKVIAELQLVSKPTTSTDAVTSETP